MGEPRCVPLRHSAAGIGETQELGTLATLSAGAPPPPLRVGCMEYGMQLGGGVFRAAWSFWGGRPYWEVAELHALGDHAL